VAVADAFDQVIQGADPARGDDRHPDRVGDRAGQRDVETRFGAVAVHRGQEQLAGAVIGEAAGPFDRVEPGRVASAMGEHAPLSRAGLPRVDRADDTLAAEFLRGLAHEIGARDGGGVDRDFIGASEQEFPDVIDGAHAAADGQRHEALIGGAAHDVVDRVAAFMAGGDVEEAQLVGAFAIVEARLLDRVAGIGQIDEVDAFDHPPVFHIETRDHAHLQHAEVPWATPPTRRSAAFASMRPS